MYKYTAMRETTPGKESARSGSISRRRTICQTSTSTASSHLIDHLGNKTALARAKAMGHSRAVPYLDWWALANSADIVVRRHAGCIAQASTFSTTARAWGLDVERAARRARPDFDGLV